MKRFFTILAILGATIIWPSSINATTESNNESDYIYYTSVTAWTDATESTTLYIYYKEGNGVRKYYTSCGDSQSDVCHLYVGENKLYNSDACSDFRHNYQYMSGYHKYFFNCNLPYFTEAVDDNGYKFHASVKAWDDPTEYTVLYIYYKEGNGVRKYYSSCNDDPDSKTCHLYVKRNKYYMSNDCNDYRRNYQYIASYHDYYFNCDLPYFTE